MSLVFRRYIPLGITFVTGLIVSSSYFIKLPELQSTESMITSWVTFMGYFAAVLATIQLSYSYGMKIIKKDKDTPYYAFALILFALMTIAGIGFGINYPVYTWLYDNLYRPVTATILAMLGFYLLSATYRAYRVKSIALAFCIISCFLFLIATAPAGPALLPQVSIIADWIRDNVSTAGLRGYVIAAAIGAISLGIRTLIGRERGYLGRAKEE
jgi:membrane-associated HD superfamily phosphohydrolase